MEAGAVEAARKMWTLAVRCEPVATELLQGVVANLCSGCAGARQALCSCPLLPSLQQLVVQVGWGGCAGGSLARELLQ